MDDAPEQEGMPPEEKPSFWQRHPVWAAVLVAASNAFTLMTFVGLESFYVLDLGPVLFCLLLTNGVIFLFKPFEKLFGKKAPWKMRLLGVPVLISICVAWYAVIVLFAWFFLSPVTISPRTTYLTGPLGTDGLVDYREEIKRRFHADLDAAKPEDNGFRLLAQGLGKGIVAFRKEPESGERWKRLCKDLRLDPGLEPSCVLVDPETVVDPEPIKAASERPWTVGEFPDLAAWVGDHDRLFDLLGEAVRKPVFVEPPVPGKNEAFVLDFFHWSCRHTVRQLARCLFYRITLRLGEGETDAAWEDVETLYRLATSLRMYSGEAQDTYYTSEFAKRANAAMRLLVREGGPDSRRLAEYARRRAALIDSISLHDLLLLKRFHALETMQRVADGTFFDASEPREKRNRFGRFLIKSNLRFAAWDRHFIAVNRFFDHAEVALAQPGPVVLQREPAAVGIDAMPKKGSVGFYFTVLKILCWKGQIGLYPALMSDMVCGNEFLGDTWHLDFITFRQTEADDRLTGIVVALERFRLDQAAPTRYPATLDRLVMEKYLPELPVDPFSTEAAPPVYRLEPDGSYALYSLGPNGRDDGGVNFYIDGGEEKNVLKEADDLCFRGGKR